VKRSSSEENLGKASPNSPSSSQFLDFADGVRAKVEARLRQRLAGEIRQLGNIGPQAASACVALSNLCLRGGKRLRAALVCTGALCFRNQRDDKLLIDIGAAVELLHTYFLVHDDWIDGDLVRRGGPSVHAILRSSYGQATGDAAAILAGDWGSAVSSDWMAQLPLPPRTLARVLAAFGQMQRAAIGGQLRDILAKDSDIELTYRLKTASYTVEGPITLGAIAAGATVDDLHALRKFAIPVGVAFQLRDDLIGLFGSPKTTGKPFGSDLRAAKRTAVAICALERAVGSNRRILAETFGNPRASNRQLKEAVQVIETVGAKSHVEQRIAQLLRLAERHIRNAPISTAGRRLLASAASALVSRSM
jgi:geranylgeranyl diphosphate synthase type I